MERDSRGNNKTEIGFCKKCIITRI